jgi:hypothetical protein
MPWYATTLHSKLLPYDVARVLSSITTLANPYFGKPPKDALDFLGRVSEADFTLFRNVRGQNSFRPLVRGKIEPEVTGSRIAIRMTLHPIVAVFLAIWVAFAGRGAVDGIFTGGLRSVDFAGPAGMVLLALTITCAFFYYEVFRTRRDLVRLLSAQLPPN